MTYSVVANCVVFVPGGCVTPTVVPSIELPYIAPSVKLQLNSEAPVRESPDTMLVKAVNSVMSLLTPFFAALALTLDEIALRSVIT